MMQLNNFFFINKLDTNMTIGNFDSFLLGYDYIGCCSSDFVGDGDDLVNMYSHFLMI